MKNLNVAVREWQEEVVFLHKIVDGAADKSYGIHVARLAGVPREVIERAKEISGPIGGRAPRRRRPGEDRAALDHAKKDASSVYALCPRRSPAAGRNRPHGLEQCYAAGGIPIASAVARDIDERKETVKCIIVIV